MSRLKRRARREADRARRKAEKRRLALEAKEDRRIEEQRAEQKRDIYEELRPIWDAWVASAKGRAQTPCQLHEFIVIWGHARGWPPRKIQEQIDLAAKFVDLHVTAKASAERRKREALKRLSPDQRIMADLLPAFGPGE